MRQNFLLFPVKDCIFPLFFITTRPAKAEVAKPLTMAVSKETQTAALEEGYDEYDDYTADRTKSCIAECGGLRKRLKKFVVLAVAVAVIVIVVYVVTVAWHGNRL